MAVREENEQLKFRDSLTKRLESDPFSISSYWQRAQLYESMAYPDLAVMDYYKVLLLTDEALDESGEYHSQVRESLVAYIASKSTSERVEIMEACGVQSDLSEKITTEVGVGDFEVTAWTNYVRARHASVSLARQLAILGCLRTAYDFVQSTLRKDSKHEEALEEMKHIKRLARSHLASKGFPQDAEEIDPRDLPDQGLVRREIYPWNNHEQDRMSSCSLELLNKEMSTVAPSLEVRITKLPALGEAMKSQVTDEAKQPGSVTQLGVFSAEDIEPGREILRERSLLTANARLHEPLCDACSAPLPALGDDRLNTAEVPGVGAAQNSNRGPVTCSECDDAIFCSDECFHLARNSYHASVCGRDIEALGKDVPPSQASDALYNQLLFRALSLSVCQNVHPLDLKETKYIWGDFTRRDSRSQANVYSSHAEKFHNCAKTLPYDFQSQVLEPLHFLERLDLPVFGTMNDLSETWVYNTLLAKFRGTASARISPRDGRPEVAAVHPLWCLANHSCDPNVEWEWAGEIQFKARTERVSWNRYDYDGTTEAVERGPRKGGIKKGEEILSHYVDVDLPVKERREWGLGALGGLCMCGE